MKPALHAHISLLLLAMLLSACGGGGSTSSLNPSANLDGSDTATTPSSSETVNTGDTGTISISNSGLNIETFDAGALTAADAGAVAKTVISALSRRITNRPSYGETRDYEAAPDQSVAETQINSDCSLAGTLTAGVNAPSQWRDTRDTTLRVFTSGDVLSSDFDQCQGLPGTLSAEIFQGHSETHFLLGFANNQGAIYGDDAVIRLVYDRMTYLFDPLLEPNYQHGSMTKTYSKLQHSLSSVSGFYSQRVAVIDETTDTLVEQIITTQENFHWQVSEGDTPELSGSGRLGSDLLGVSFTMNVDTPLQAGLSTNTGWQYEIINAGSITASGTQGTLQIDFHQDYLSYRFDGDADGDFETSGVLFWYQVLPTAG